MDINSYLSGFASLTKKSAAETGDFNTLGNTVLGKVTSFLVTNQLAKAGNIVDYWGEPVACNESLQAPNAMTALPASHIMTLVQECGIKGAFVDPACKAVAATINKYFSNKKGDALLASQRKEVKNWNSDSIVMGLENLYSANLVNMFKTSWGTEDFGAGMSTILPDLRMAISVAIMQFHNGLTARVVPVQTATEPVVQYKRQDLKVYNVADTEDKDKDLVDLFFEPDMLANQLIKIKVLEANDTEDVIVSDGILRFGVTANLFKLALDPTKYGTDKFNRTDVVADGVKVESVLFTISNGTTTETFQIKLPMASNKLFPMVNAAHAGMRGTTINHSTFLNKDSKLASGAATVLLAGFDDEGLNVDIKLNPEINLRNSEMIATGIITVKKHHISDPLLISASLDTFYASLYTSGGAHKPALVGYEPDARYGEENIRKSQTATRLQTRHLVQPIPPGKNYLLETAMGQNEEENGASHLTQIIRIGQDVKTLTTLTETLEHVFDLNAEMFINPLKPGVDPGHAFIAGSIVRPRVTIAPLNANDITSMKDSDRASDVRSMIQYKFSYFVEKLLAETGLIAQIPGGQRPTFKIITSSIILNNLFGVQHIHQHMNDHKPPAYDGIEYTRVLDSGITLQFVTTLFTKYRDKVIVLPVIPGDPDSFLNWGHNWDHGTVVGNYNHSQDTAVWNRMFANTREITLPTNPMGMLITVSGIEAAMKLPD